MDRYPKTALEMDFEEFLAWSVGMVLFGIGRGEKLRDIMRHILNHASRNEVWGRKKKGQ